MPATAAADRPDPPRLVSAPTGERPGVLLAVAQAVANRPDPEALVRDLAAALRPFLPPGYVSFSLIDPATRVARLQLLEPVGAAARPDPTDTPVALAGSASPTAVVWESQRPLWVPAADPPAGLTGIAGALRRQGVHAALFVPLTTPHRRLGAMAFSSYRPVAPADADTEFLAQVGRLVALAVEATLMRQELEQANDRLGRERRRLELLLEIGEAVTARLDLPGLQRAVGNATRRAAGHRLTALWLPDPDGRHLRAAAEVVEADRAAGGAEVPIDASPAGEAYRTGRPVRYACPGGGPAVAVPLQCGGETVGVLGLTAEGPAGDEETVGLLEQVARPVAVAVANARAYRRIEALTARLAVEKAYLEEEIRREGRFDDMVGHSLALRDALHLVEAAAATDTTVLVLGETGTGKELVARAVHRLSRRAGRTFVKLNCAAIPTGLLESELFGHERGAFTGAVDRRIGRFELADGGTLFLDEVGDIPVELQAKLLRVLQEQEFERIGSGRTLKVDVRLVAATHRDLPRMVADGRFRADLFYRLHVFPIRLPPLRERADDIPELARHFARVFAQRFGRPAPVVTDELAAALQAYPWPGNVRELEHLIERAVILTNGPELRLPPGGLPAAAAEPADGRAGPASALRSAEREAIRRALDESGGVVGGPHGAAARLGVKRTTLLSMMKRHGLSRPKPPASNR